MTVTPRTPARMLGIDYGERRIGLAVSDGTLAVPLTIIEHTRRDEDLDRIVRIVRDEHSEAVVVGLPLLMSGDLGEQAQRTRRFAEALERRVDVPVLFHDERLSSFRAEADAPDARRSRARRHRDDAAAAIILQSYIDTLLAAPAGRSEPSA